MKIYDYPQFWFLLGVMWGSLLTAIFIKIAQS